MAVSFWQSVRYCMLHVQSFPSRREFFSGKKFLFMVVFGPWANGLPMSVETICSSAFANAFCVCRGVFCGTIFSKKNFVNNCCLLSQKICGLSKTFQTVVTIAIPLSREKFDGKNEKWEHKGFQKFFGTGATCLQTFVKTISTGLPYLLCTCAE